MLRRRSHTGRHTRSSRQSAHRREPTHDERAELCHARRRIPVGKLEPNGLIIACSRKLSDRRTQSDTIGRPILRTDADTDSRTNAIAHPGPDRSTRGEAV
jgi:hypothetical protein